LAISHNSFFTTEDTESTEKRFFDQKNYLGVLCALCGKKIKMYF
jgi:hypothetical protein